VPVELLQQYYGATYTTPQTHQPRCYVNLTGKVDGHAELDDRRFRPCASSITRRWMVIRPERSQRNTALLCFGRQRHAGIWLNGVQLANLFGNAVLGENDRTTTRSTTTGVSLQATIRIPVRSQQSSGGRASFDSSVSRCAATAELGTIGPHFVVSGSGIFLGNPAIRYRSPVALRTTNQIYRAVYALDTFDVTNAFSITAGAGQRGAASGSRIRSAAPSTAMRRSTVQSDHRRHL